jgi:nuclear RNA export factor
MLKLSSGTTHNMGKSKVTRGRATALDRGGIRKRGAPATRIDPDGDLDMNGSSQRGRGGKRARGDSGRAALSQARDGRRMAVDRDRALNTIQKALSGNGNSQVNIRRGGAKGGPWEQVSVRGWRKSKAATNPDGGTGSLVSFLEKKIAPPDSKAADMRNNIMKVCATPASSGHRRSIPAASYFFGVFLVSGRSSTATIDAFHPRPCRVYSWVTAVFKVS